MELRCGPGRIRLALGDIAAFKADAIVNAANSGLLGGGGVDGAIHAAGGPEILEECERIRADSGPCPTGKAVITGAGRLEADFVIHAVGPVWKGGALGEPEFLRGAYLESLRLAESKGCRSVLLPAISTGIYGYPVEKAAPVALETVAEFLKTASAVREATFVLFSKDVLEVFERALEGLRIRET